MITIEDKEMEGSLKKSYEFYKVFMENNEKEKLIFAKGFCSALEKIAIAYGSFTYDQIVDIKNNIVGDIVMTFTDDNDLDTPTYVRKNITI